MLGRWVEWRGGVPVEPGWKQRQELPLFIPKREEGTSVQVGTSVGAPIRVFSNESAVHIKWSKYCSFNFNISPSNEHPGLISFRIDWVDLLAV